jgi:PAS domain S-box-containing protein
MTALEDLAAHLPKALERITLPSYVLNPDGTIRWINQEARRLVGDVVGRPAIEMVAPEDRARASEAFEKRLRGEHVDDYEVHVLLADGGQARVEISAVPLTTNEHAVGIFGLAVQWKNAKAAAGQREYRLTPRQRDVLNLLAAGASTDQIAAELTLSRETVRNHIRRILGALGARSRLEAVAIAHRAGLV